MKINGVSTSELHHVSGFSVRKEQFTHLGLVHQLPYNDRNNEKWDANVRRDEIARTPVALQEDRESSDQRNNSGSDETIPCGKRLEGTLPGQAISAESLRLHSSMEADEAEA